MKPRMATFLAIALFVLSMPGSAAGQKTERSLIGEFGATGGALYECPAGSALAGFGQWHTDRLTGLSVSCVKLKQTLGPIWESPDAVFVEAPALHLGQQPQDAAAGNTTCPYNFIMIGLGGEIADYQEHLGNGLAQVDAPRMRIVDLAPVCRGPDGAVFHFQKGRLAVATPLRRQADVSWTIPTGCPTGFGAVGVHYAIQRTRDVAGFSGLALICDRLDHTPRPGTTTPVHP